MRTRRAEARDAPEAVTVLRRSITELCREEWRNDPEVLARWLANKTEANLHRWIGDPGRRVCLAERGGVLVAVGMATRAGEIQFNYVLPEARFTGAGKALMADMEAYLRGHGVAEARLFSTQLARPFYRALGYEEIGPVPSDFGTLDITAMRKRLRPDDFGGGSG